MYALTLFVAHTPLAAMWGGERFDFAASGGRVVIACQQAALIEPVLCILGVIPSSIVTVLFQLLARNVVILLVVARHAEMQDHTSVCLFLAAWLLIEVVRFPWLCFKITGTPPRLLSIARYAAPLVLYPLGGAGEGWTMWRAAASGDAITFAGYSFTLGGFITFVYLPAYLPGFLFLYSAALKQFRRNVLSSASSKRSANK